ncbi:MAG: long-chain fatty acid--CoA ligase [Bacillota bacterium]
MSEKAWYAFWPKGMPKTLSYPELPVGAILRGSAERFGDREALVYNDRSWTYRQLYEQALRFANALRAKGIGKGDVVAIHMMNVPQYAIAYYGILFSGATFTPVNPLLPPADLSYQLNDSGAKVVITHELVARAIQSVQANTKVEWVVLTGESEAMQDQPVDTTAYGETWSSFLECLRQSPAEELEVDIDPRRDLAHLAYTGGTTGRSKGVMLSHYHVVVNTIQYACWGTGSRPVTDGRRLWLEPIDPSLIGEDAEYRVPLGNEVMVNITPWFHAMGTVGYLNRPFLVGAKIIVHVRFDPEKYLADAEKYRVTSIGGAPPVFVALLRHPDFAKRDLSSVRSISSGAAPLAQELIHLLQQRLPEVTIVEAYGMTEVTMGATSNPSGRSAVRKVGSVGIPVFDTEVKIVPLEGGEEPLPPGEVGEICVRGPQVMIGYYNKPEETANVLKDGWMHTGDVGYMDEDGYVFIVDRKKDMLIYKGYNVYPRELEEILFRHPAVANAAVIGKPDPEVGEIPKAFVVLKPGQTVTAEALMEFVNEQVAPYKKLREVAFVDEIPVSPAGKVLKRVLRDMEMKQSGS